MDAYFRRRGEDRVTEMLAMTLAGARSYVYAVADHIGLVHPADWEVETQVPAAGCVVDLEICGKDQEGRPAWILWSEHKVRATFGRDQLTRLSNALRQEAAATPTKLIAITLRSPSQEVRAQAETNGVELLRWRDVVRLAEQAGTTLPGGPAWRVQSDSESGNGERRRLLEWLSFCEHELEETSVEPLTIRDIEILPRAEQARATIDELLEGGFEKACAHLVAGPPKAKDEWSAAPPEGTWLADHRCTLYVKHDTDETWRGVPPETPVFVAGIFTVGEDAEELASDEALVGALDESSFNVWIDGKGSRAEFDIYQAVPMEEIAAQGTVELQEEHLAEFFRRVFEQILSLPVPA
jgi:hypothetical protein